MKKVRVRPMRFNDMQTFSKAFLNTNCRNDFTFKFVFDVCTLRNTPWFPGVWMYRYDLL